MQQLPDNAGLDVRIEGVPPQLQGQVGQVEAGLHAHHSLLPILGKRGTIIVSIILSVSNPYSFNPDQDPAF